MADDAPGPPTRPSLLRLRDPRDAASWALFRDVYGSLAWRHCRRRGLQPADDVTQRVFARVSRAVRAFEYRRERGRFRDWLGRLTRHELARSWASSRRGGAGEAAGPEALETAEAPGQGTQWQEEGERHVLGAALGRTRPHFGGPPGGRSSGPGWRAARRPRRPRS